MRASLYVGVVCIAVMAMAAGAALADDMFPPPWRHGTPPNATVDPGAVAVGFEVATRTAAVSSPSGSSRS